MPALRKITDPARLPDFRPAFDADREGLLTALNLSIGWFAKPSSKKFFPVQDITHERAAASLAAFREILTSAHSGDELQARILAGFDVYESVGCDDAGTVLFTGYYTPIFDASLTPTAEYRWPLYKTPPDLVKDANGDCIGRKLPDGTVEKSYYSRAEIDQGAVKGQELVYLKDRFEAYVCTVEGSAQLRLPDGTHVQGRLPGQQRQELHERRPVARGGGASAEGAVDALEPDQVLPAESGARWTSTSRATSDTSSSRKPTPRRRAAWACR